MPEPPARPWFATWGPVVGLLLLGLILRLWGAAAHWRAFDAEHPSTWRESKLELSQDANQYIQQADPDTWATFLHRGWAERPHFRPPLASYYFVGLFRTVSFDRMAAATIQGLLAALAYLLLFLSVQRLFGRATGLVSLAVIALHPVLMFYDVSFEDSTLALFLLAATTYATLWACEGRTARWLVPGTTSGLLLLARPSLLPVAIGVVALATGWAKAKGKSKTVLACLLPLAYVIAPVIWHNHAVSGRWVAIADSAGQNLFWGNNTYADYRLSVQGYWNIREVDMGSAAELLTQGLKARHGKRYADDAYAAEAMSFLTSHPGHAVAGFFDKAWRHLSTYEIPRNTNFEALRDRVAIWRLPFAPYPIVLVLALIGVIGFERRPAVLFLLPWLAAVLSEVVFFNASRYRALAIPFLVPFAIRALWLGYRSARERRWRGLVLPTAAVTVACVLGFLAVSSVERTRHLAVDHFKDAMLESYADRDGAWQRFSEDRFRRSLNEARRLDPLNLDAFMVEQKYLLSQGNHVQAAALASFRDTQCRPGEWLCHDLCAYARRLAGR